MVVLIPSVGRSAADFDLLGHGLEAAGYRAVMPEPRGIGKSTGLIDGLSMGDLATDIATVITVVGGPAAQATVVGHAFGNRVARMVATDHPSVVRDVVLLACGGAIPPAPEVTRALRRVFDTSLGAQEHLACVRSAFFAPGSDASVWEGGWYPLVAAVQGQANRSTAEEHWWYAGRAEVLVVQPADDVIAVPANAQRVLDDLGDRARIAVVEHAGHALLPEQPDAVATRPDHLARPPHPGRSLSTTAETATAGSACPPGRHVLRGALQRPPCSAAGRHVSQGVVQQPPCSPAECHRLSGPARREAQITAAQRGGSRPPARRAPRRASRRPRRERSRARRARRASYRPDRPTHTHRWAWASPRGG